MAYCRITINGDSDLTFDLDGEDNSDYTGDGPIAKFEITDGPSAPNTGDFDWGSNTISVQDGDIVLILIGDDDDDDNSPVSELNISSINGAVSIFDFGEDYNYATVATDLLNGTSITTITSNIDGEIGDSSNVRYWNGAFEDSNIVNAELIIGPHSNCEAMFQNSNLINLTNPNGDFRIAPRLAGEMFAGCVDLSVPPKMDLQYAEDVNSIFEGTAICENGETLDIINTEGDIDWSWALKDTPVSEVPFSIAGNKHTEMLKDCHDLKCVKAIDTTNSTDTTDMFLNAGQNLINGEPRSPSAVEQANILAGSDWIASCDCPSKIFVEEEEVHRIYHGENQIKKAKIAE